MSATPFFKFPNRLVLELERVRRCTMLSNRANLQVYLEQVLKQVLKFVGEMRREFNLNGELKVIKRNFEYVRHCSPFRRRFSRRSVWAGRRRMGDSRLKAYRCLSQNSNDSGIGLTYPPSHRLERQGPTSRRPCCSPC